MGLLDPFIVAFLFQRLDYSVSSIALFYIAIYSLHSILSPVGAEIMSRIGSKKTMILAIFCLVFYCLSL